MFRVVVGVLIQMAGHGGSGKSTIARAIANRTGGVVLDLDTIKSALLASGVTWAESSSAGYSVIYGLVEDMLTANSATVIVDTPSYWREIQQRLTTAADAHGAEYRFVECVAEESVRAARLEQRPARRSQIRELGTNPVDAPATADAVHLRAIQRPARRTCIQVLTHGELDIDAVMTELSLPAS